MDLNDAQTLEEFLESIKEINCDVSSENMSIDTSSISEDLKTIKQILVQDMMSDGIKEEFYNICKCGEEMFPKNGVYTCDACGYIDPNLTIDLTEEQQKAVTSSYNFSTNGRSLRAKGSKRLNRAFAQDQTYTNIQEENFVKRMLNKKFGHGRKSLPMYTIVEACKIYCNVIRPKIDEIFRSRSLTSILAKLAQIKSIDTDIGFISDKDIADMFSIKQHDLNIAEKKLIKWYNLQIIDVKVTLDSDKLKDIYVNQCFKHLKIPEKFKEFVFDIIDNIDRARLSACFNSFIQTKCAAIIYLLTRVDEEIHENIKPSMIEEEMSVSTATMKKYYDSVIVPHKWLLWYPFQKHRIPMPYEWKYKEKTTKRGRSKKYTNLGSE
jgi:hypothetical protein